MDESKEDQLPSYEEATRDGRTRYPPKLVDQLAIDKDSKDFTSQYLQAPATQARIPAQAQVQTGTAQSVLRITHPHLLASKTVPFPHAPFLSLQDDPIELPGLTKVTIPTYHPRKSRSGKEPCSGLDKSQKLGGTEGVSSSREAILPDNTSLPSNSNKHANHPSEPLVAPVAPITPQPASPSESLPPSKVITAALGTKQLSSYDGYVDSAPRSDKAT